MSSPDQLHLWEELVCFTWSKARCCIIIIIIIIIILKLYCHIQRALHEELECSLALTHIVPIYTIK